MQNRTPSDLRHIAFTLASKHCYRKYTHFQCPGTPLATPFFFDLTTHFPRVHEQMDPTHVRAIQKLHAGLDSLGLASGEEH